MLKTLPRMAAERLVWVLVVAGVACSSRITPPVDSIALDATPLLDTSIATDADSAVNLPTPLTTGEFIDRLVGRFCELKASCTGQAGFRGSPCTALKDRYPTFLARQRLRLVELGRLQFDGIAAAQCLQAMDCGILAEIVPLGAPHRTNQVQPAPEPCARIFHGALEMGQGCQDDAECATGACWGCPGTCRAPVARGAKCSVDSVCGVDDTCIDATCEEAAPRGPGQACVTTYGCTEGYSCLGFPNTSPNKCVPALKAGDACTFFCDQEWLACVKGKCQQAAIGAPCTDGTDCPSGAYCQADIAGTQRCWPYRSNLEPCGAGACPSVQHCVDAKTITCASMLADGEPCDAPHSICQNVCDAATLHCRAWQVCQDPSCVNCSPDGVTCLDLRVGDPCSGTTCTDADPDMQQIYPMICANGQCALRNKACMWLANP